MAISQVYTAVPLDVISAARWNNEFGNVYNNGTALAFPLTQSVSFAGYSVRLDAAGATSIASTSSASVVLAPGAKTGTPNVGGSVLTVQQQTFTDTATSASGTASAYASVGLDIPSVAASNANVTVTDAATLYIANAPAASTNVTLTNAYALWIDEGTIRTDGKVYGTLVHAGHIEGLLFSNNGSDATNDIDIAVGLAASTHATPASRRLLTLASAVTKRLDASWVTGTNQGGLSSSLSISNTDYFIHLIQVAGVVDVGFDTSRTAANLIADHGATAYRRIGWIRRASNTIVPFTTTGQAGGGILYLWTTPPLDVDLAATLTTSRRSDVISVPLSEKVLAHITVSMLDAAIFTARVCSPSETDAAPSSTASPLQNIKGPVAGQYEGTQLTVLTDTSGQISARCTVATMDQYKVMTDGFEWSRQ
jgi:hypothetical protein